MKPKILYIHGGGDAIGGIETYLARSLKYHSSVEPYLAVVRRGRVFDYMRDSGFGNLFDLEGGRLRDGIKFIKALYRARQIVRREGIALIAAHGPHSWIFAGATAKICGLKSLYYVQGEIKKEDFRHPVSGLSLMLKPDVYVANSQFTAKTIMAHIPKARVAVNCLASDIHEFDCIDEAAARARLRAEFNIAEDKFIFCVTGRIQAWKGQDTAIAAFKDMRMRPRAALLVVGDCTFASDEPFYERLKLLSGGDRSIIFTGFRRDVPFIMKASDAVLHTSREAEPFGIVVVEGMMAKKPVIATAHGGPEEIIERGRSGFLFPPEDFAQLARIMDSLVENGDLCCEVSARAYERAKAKFSMEASVGRLERIMRDTLGCEMLDGDNRDT